MIPVTGADKAIVLEDFKIACEQEQFDFVLDPAEIDYNGGANHWRFLAARNESGQEPQTSMSQTSIVTAEKGEKIHRVHTVGANYSPSGDPCL